MSTDRELLELAAKAAGYESWDFLSFDFDERMNVYDLDGTQYSWNPLDDDGDALRLAVKLRLDVEFHQDNGGAVSAINYDLCRSSNMRLQGAGVDFNEDEFAATRRAIVRAAAEIGKAKEDK